MDWLLTTFSNYSTYIILSVIIYAVVLALISSNAEDCPYHAECFRCNKVTCEGCTCLSFRMDLKQKEPELTELRQDYGGLLYYSSNAKLPNHYHSVEK